MKARVGQLSPANTLRRVLTIESIVDEDIRKMEGRIGALVNRRRLMLAVIAERAKSVEHQDVPGMSTGIVCVEEKLLGGKDGRKTKVSKVDVPLLAELRATEKQIAEEIAEYTQKHSTTLNYAKLSDVPKEIRQRWLAEAEALERRRLLEEQREKDEKPN